MLNTLMAGYSSKTQVGNSAVGILRRNDDIMALGAESALAWAQGELDHGHKFFIWDAGNNPKLYYCAPSKTKLDLGRWRGFRNHKDKLLGALVRIAGADELDKRSENFVYPVLFERKGISVVGHRVMSNRLSKLFDPAVWLEWAERIGYEIYLWDAYGDGSLGILTINPTQPHERDIDLWWSLRPNEGQDHINEKALKLYLWDTGRVGPEEMRPAYASAFTREDVSRRSERHRAIFGQSGAEAKRGGNGGQS